MLQQQKYSDVAFFKYMEEIPWKNKINFLNYFYRVHLSYLLFIWFIYDSTNLYMSRQIIRLYNMDLCRFLSNLRLQIWCLRPSKLASISRNSKVGELRDQIENENHFFPTTKIEVFCRHHIRIAFNSKLCEKGCLIQCLVQVISLDSRKIIIISDMDLPQHRIWSWIISNIN